MNTTPNKITPNNITSLAPNEIFVFGANKSGRHGKGAALTALRQFGAISGQGTGLMGQSYGIATKGYKLEILPLKEIRTQVASFLDFAELHYDKEFLVTEIGCGLAGYHPKDIAPLFTGDIPSNVSLPERFYLYLNKKPS